jgi:hypothetical protein
VAALVALASSFALGALGIAFGLLVAGLLLPWPAAQVRLISPRRPTVPPIEHRHPLIWPAGPMLRRSGQGVPYADNHAHLTISRESNREACIGAADRDRWKIGEYYQWRHN